MKLSEPAKWAISAILVITYPVWWPPVLFGGMLYGIILDVKVRLFNEKQWNGEPIDPFNRKKDEGILSGFFRAFT